MKIFFIGDIVGQGGIDIIKKELPAFLLIENIDIVIANAENAASGFGITPKIANELFSYGIDIITLGNHIFDKKEIILIINDKRIVRPINYASKLVPGKGWTFFLTKKGKKIAIINVLGRVFMNFILDCPFKAVEDILSNIKKETNIIFIDFHAEATSEKQAFGYFLDGKVSAIVGTHTHVATSDERILPFGSAYITDVGMTGSIDSVIGMKKDKIIYKFLTQMNTKYEVEELNSIMQGVLIEIDENTGKALSINRIKKG